MSTLNEKIQIELKRRDAKSFLRYYLTINHPEIAKEPSLLAEIDSIVDNIINVAVEEALMKMAKILNEVMNDKK